MPIYSCGCLSVNEAPGSAAPASGKGPLMSSVSALNSLLGSSSSSNGIDISSILQALTGSTSSGLDVTTAVDAAVTAASAPETAWNTQLTSTENQVSTLQQIQTDVQNLDNDVQQLNSITGPLASNAVTSS